MKFDAPNRSFLAIVSVTLLLAAYVLCGAFGNVLAPPSAEPVSRRGLAALPDGGGLAVILVLATVVAVGLAFGARSVTRQLASSRRLGRRARELTLPMPDTLAMTAVAVGLDGRVLLLDEPAMLSFVYGVLTPRVAVSHGLLEGVTRAELRAVLEHERYHVENLDPLKLLLAQTLSAAFFFLPAVGTLRTRYLATRELAADRRAVDMCGRRPLASALLKVARGPDWVELEDVAAIGGAALLDVRVAQLETGVEPKPAPLAATRGVLSLAGGAVVGIAILASASSFGVALTTADLLNGLICTAPFAGGGMLLFGIVAHRAKQPLPGGGDRSHRGV